MSENEIKICSVCQFENPADATECARCGSPLESYNTTIQVPDKPAQQQEPPDYVRVTRRPATPGDAITLFVLGHSQPLIINGHEHMILGRVAAAGPVPTIDLSGFNAHMLGVSRQHAAIRRTDEGYTLEDLDSTNGTWLNENRLFPDKPATLQNGDLFRLGQLMMVAYFSPSSAPVEKTIFLRDLTPVSGGLGGLSPQYLVTVVTPYLETIAGLQHIVDDVKGRDPSEVSIVSLDMVSGRIKVTMKGATEAIQVLQRKVLPWRAKYVANLEGMAQQAEDKQHDMPDDDLIETRTVGESGQRASRPALHPAQTRVLAPARMQPSIPHDFPEKLAAVVLDEVSPGLPDESRGGYFDRLVPLLNHLLVSTLEVTDRENEE
jgi:hypothetical protein